MSLPETSFPKDQIKVLLCDGVSQTAVDLLEREGFQVETAKSLSPEALLEKIKDVHAVGVRSKTFLTKEVLSQAKRLLAVGCFCIGTDQTDLDFARLCGVPVFNSPFANTRSVAEIVIAHIIYMYRHAGDRLQEMHKGIWNKQSKGCHEIRRKTLGIIGYGHVGSQLSVIAEALNMNVIFYDNRPVLALGRARATNSMKELLTTADVVSLHVPFDETTENLIGAKEIAMMKPGSYLVNYARGKVADPQAAADAIKSGHLAGCAFDVFPTEPRKNTEDYVTPLQGLPNVLLTPHIGGSTIEAQADIGAEVAHKLIDFISFGRTTAAVNFPQISLPETSDAHHLIINAHKNRPGVMKAINSVLEDYNIVAQSLATKNDVGFLMVHVDKEVSHEILSALTALPANIRTRVMY